MTERPANTDLTSYLSEFVKGFPTDQRRKLTVNGTEIPFTPGADINIQIEIEDLGSININHTYEGIVTDTFDENGDPAGTSSIMYSERFEQFAPKPVNLVIADLQREFDGRDPALLDDLVHDQQCENATEVNNEGISAQIEEIIQCAGEERGEQLIREAFAVERRLKS